MNPHRLTLDPADPTTYLVDGERERMTPHPVTVAVKGGAPVTRTQWWTRYGPVVDGLDPTLTLPWTATMAYALGDPNAVNLRMSDTALGFARSRSTRELAETPRRTQGLPWVNTIAADSAGHTPLGVWNCTNARWDPAGGGYTEVVAGSSHIQAVGWDGSGCPVARTLLTYSQSDDPGSAHFSDQTRLFSDGRWVTSRYCEKEILSSPALKVVTVGE